MCSETSEQHGYYTMPRMMCTLWVAKRLGESESEVNDRLSRSSPSTGYFKYDRLPIFGILLSR